MYRICFSWNFRERYTISTPYKTPTWGLPSINQPSSTKKSGGIPSFNGILPTAKSTGLTPPPPLYVTSQCPNIKLCFLPTWFVSSHNISFPVPDGTADLQGFVSLCWHNRFRDIWRNWKFSLCCSCCKLFLSQGRMNQVRLLRIFLVENKFFCPFVNLTSCQLWFREGKLFCCTVDQYAYSIYIYIPRPYATLVP